MSDDANDFLFGGGAKAFPFDNVGDTVTGRIVSMEKRQQSDMQTGKPAFWDDGNPKMMLMVAIQTDMHESDDDDGMRSVYLRGGNHTAVSGKGTSSQMAVKDAVRRSGSERIETGGTLTMQFSGIGKQANKGFNPPKLYVASYKAPSYAVDVDDLA
jgi:hypothetical protein